MGLHAVLTALCPMFVHVDALGQIMATGPTFVRVFGRDPRGDPFRHVVEVVRPKNIANFRQFLENGLSRVRLRLNNPDRTRCRAVMVPDGQGGAVFNLTPDLASASAIGRFGLTANDFAYTDLTIDLLYLIEANAITTGAFRTQSRRLQVARNQAIAEAATDPLTGLANRRAVEAKLDALLARDAPFAVMHVDLDHFKAVNDTLGHAAGDHVLRSVSGRMQRELRTDDVVGRIGGDEFLVLLPRARDTAPLADIATRLIAAIERPLTFEGQAARVSASIGIALRGTDAVTATDLIAAADAALYASKRGGRGRFEFAQPQPTPAEKGTLEKSSG